MGYVCAKCYNSGQYIETPTLIQGDYIYLYIFKVFKNMFNAYLKDFWLNFNPIS